MSQWYQRGIIIRNVHIYRAAYRDAVAQSGTGPALLALKEWIKSRKVQGEEAAQILAGLPTAARYPNLEYMKNFFVSWSLSSNYKSLLEK